MNVRDCKVIDSYIRQQRTFPKPSGLRKVRSSALMLEFQDCQLPRGLTALKTFRR